MLYILNTPILTIYGSYTYEPINETRVAAEMQHHGFESAVGHQGAADAINAVLQPYQISIEMNRQAIQMEKKDMAVVFKLNFNKLNARVPAGAILTRQQVEEVGFEWGLITRTA